MGFLMVSHVSTDHEQGHRLDTALRGSWDHGHQQASAWHSVATQATYINTDPNLALSSSTGHSYSCGPHTPQISTLLQAAAQTTDIPVALLVAQATDINTGLATVGPQTQTWP